MTDKERLARERDWVRARSECAVESVFNTLVSVIENDIQTFNKLSGKDDCEINRLENLTVTFRRSNRVTAISTAGKTIRAAPSHEGIIQEVYEIEPKWNEETMFCDLMIGGKKLSMHRASQKIIGSVLFPDGN